MPVLETSRDIKYGQHTILFPPVLKRLPWIVLQVGSSAFPINGRDLRPEEVAGYKGSVSCENETRDLQVMHEQVSTPQMNALSSRRASIF